MLQYLCVDEGTYKLLLLLLWLVLGLNVDGLANGHGHISLNDVKLQNNDDPKQNAEKARA